MEPDEERAEKRKESEKDRRKRVLNAFRSLLDREDGRLALSVVLGLTGIEVENLAEGYTAARVEGARCVGIRLIRTLREANFDGWLKLEKEMLNG